MTRTSTVVAFKRIRSNGPSVPQVTAFLFICLLPLTSGYRNPGPRIIDEDATSPNSPSNNVVYEEIVEDSIEIKVNVSEGSTPYQFVLNGGDLSDEFVINLEDIDEDCIKLENLSPSTSYNFYFVTKLNSSMDIKTEKVFFRTKDSEIQGYRSYFKAEEIGIVLIILTFWMFAIGLFFNRWGKIRMLEPYHQPFKAMKRRGKRASCPGLVEPCVVSKYLQTENVYTGTIPKKSLVGIGRSRSLCIPEKPTRRHSINFTEIIPENEEIQSKPMTTMV